MVRLSKAVMLIGAAAFAGAGVAGGALAQAQAGNQRSTPKDWPYEIKNGQRVPKATNRVTKPDGSWREEVRRGACVTIREKSAAGEYREIRRCD